MLNYEVVELYRRNENNWIEIRDGTTIPSARSLTLYLQEGWELVLTDPRFIQEEKQTVRVYILRKLIEGDDGLGF